MANKLKRNYIQLVEKVNDKGEPEFETYLTPHFISASVWYESIDTLDQIQTMEDDLKAEYKAAEEADEPVELKSSSTLMKEQIEMLMDTVVKIYGKQFTKKDLKAKMHAPNMIEDLREQLEFIASGQQDEATKKFVESKS
ncbi:phage tail assembly chaperone G [Jeotgalicoccus sp. WY2]|uniref:phage tail assembly chaperone G n=1 Tax=Jeotgalicoccus sp. WY2 TaxID=2708346 RepID=UPI001BD27D74|nr:hypothetical protein [Jeotgalicoccus sp. WY2]